MTVGDVKSIGWEQAPEILHAGDSIAYPTDTLWGLGCRADDPNVVRACLRLKGPVRQPWASVVVRQAWLDDLVMVSPEMTLDRFFPGAYTLILPLKDGSYAHVAGPGGTLGCRIPDLPQLDRLLKHLGCPMVSTSLNRHGQPSARTWAEARIQAQALGVPLIEWDRQLRGPSTVLRWREDRWECLRPGIAPVPDA